VGRWFDRMAPEFATIRRSGAIRRKEAKMPHYTWSWCTSAAGAKLPMLVVLGLKSAKIEWRLLWGPALSGEIVADWLGQLKPGGLFSSFWGPSKAPLRLVARRWPVLVTIDNAPSHAAVGALEVCAKASGFVVVGPAEQQRRPRRCRGLRCARLAFVAPFVSVRRWMNVGCRRCSRMSASCGGSVVVPVDGAIHAAVWV
jgi:hypothetical protein